jgi:hypothetical protein
MRVYPVPLVRESSFRRVRVAIRPGSTAAYGAVILGLKNLGKNRSRFGADEGFGQESNLVMYCLVLAVDSDIDRSCAPSVFQATTLDSQRAAGKTSFMVTMISGWQAERPVSSTAAVPSVE